MKAYCFIIFLIFIVFQSCSKEKPYEQVLPSPTIDNKVPKLTTDSIASLGHFSVLLKGHVIDTGASKLIEQGILVGLSSDPTVASHLNKFELQVDSNENFQITAIGLPSNTTFYVRAYGINAQGIGYGNEVKFTSLQEKRANIVGNIILTTQKEVNAFGANNFTYVNNGIEINGSDITDLTPLKSIAIIGNRFVIENTSLKNLHGLESLEVASSDFFAGLTIRDNHYLKDLTGLNNLRFIRGDYIISNNKELESLQGLNKLSMVHGGNFVISNCGRLETLDALENLVLIDGTISLIHNTVLNDIKGLRNVEIVTGDIFFSENNSLMKVDELEKLKSINTLTLKDNPVLTNLDGFKNVKTLKALVLENNELLNDLTAFKNLKTVEYLEIARCNSITNLKGVNNIETIKQKLSISNNPNLISIKDLEKLHTAKTIEISFNQSLPNLKGLDSLKRLVGSPYSITISQNKSLNSLTGLENLRTAEGQIYIEFNAEEMDYCPLKPFLSQYSGNSFSLHKYGGITVSKAQILTSCP